MNGAFPFFLLRGCPSSASPHSLPHATPWLPQAVARKRQHKHSASRVLLQVRGRTVVATSGPFAWGWLAASCMEEGSLLLSSSRCTRAACQVINRSLVVQVDQLVWQLCTPSRDPFIQVHPRLGPCF